MANASRYMKAAAIYARTLFDMAQSQGVTAEVTGEMQALSTLFKKEKAVVNALQNPALSGEKKATLVDPLSKRATVLTGKIIRLLVLKNRLALLPELAEAYLRREEESRQVHRAKVVSAVALTGQQLEALAKLLADKKPGSSYQLENTLDPHLVAGFRVEEGGRILDASLRHKLDTIQQRLAA
jgi:F-type H+-transporting ATPase subunit delta